MKALLEFLLRYLDFFYLDPRYRITNSTTSGVANINASLRLTGPVISWEISNDRGQIGFGAAPTKFSESPDNWFRISLIRQYLDGFDELNAVSSAETVSWIRDNIDRIEQLFTDSSATHSCEELIALAKSLAIKYWGPPS